MSSVTSPSPKKKPTIVVPSTSGGGGGETKASSSKEKPEFVVPALHADSTAPLGVSVSKFNKTHIVVRYFVVGKEIPMIYRFSLSIDKSE